MNECSSTARSLRKGCGCGELAFLMSLLHLLLSAVNKVLLQHTTLLKKWQMPPQSHKRSLKALPGLQMTSAESTPWMFTSVCVSGSPPPTPCFSQGVHYYMCCSCSNYSLKQECKSFLSFISKRLHCIRENIIPPLFSLNSHLLVASLRVLSTSIFEDSHLFAK